MINGEIISISFKTDNEKGVLQQGLIKIIVKFRAEKAEKILRMSVSCTKHPFDRQKILCKNTIV